MFKNRFEKASRIAKVAAIRAKNELSTAMELEQNAIAKATMLREAILREAEIAQHINSPAVTIGSYMKWIHLAQHERDKTAEMYRLAHSDTQRRRSIFIEARKVEEMINILNEKEIYKNNKNSDN